MMRIDGKLAWFLFACFLIVVTIFNFQNRNVYIPYYVEKAYHRSYNLPIVDLKNLSNVNMFEFKRLLKPILVERVVGSGGHSGVKDFIVSELRKLNWVVELDEFKDKIPKYGDRLFTNIIATYNPNAPRNLVFACHYDSKLMPFKFVAATDSAVPCAMLLYLAGMFDGRRAQNFLASERISLKLIFFDGEEAFVSWSPTDSLYGARHLASMMEQTAFAYDGSVDTNHLHKIDLLVLLDLLGESNPTFYDYFPDTSRWYKKLMDIEERLHKNKILAYESSSKWQYFTNGTLYDAHIGDDHEPFIVKGVPVLHIIPTPFPQVWHTEYDEERYINYTTVKNLLMIFRIFIAEYLNGFLDIEDTVQ